MLHDIMRKITPYLALVFLGFFIGGLIGSLKSTPRQDMLSPAAKPVPTYNPDLVSDVQRIVVYLCLITPIGLPTTMFLHKILDSAIEWL